MGVQPWWHTLAAIGGWTLAAAGVVLLLWALFGDRSRGRRRCPKCWYDMSGVPGLVCPECGRDARQEKRLQRTRRWLRFAFLGALLALAGCAGTKAPAVASDGWAAATPTWGLIAMMPLAAREDVWQRSFSGLGWGATVHNELVHRLRPAGPPPRGRSGSPAPRRMSGADRWLLKRICFNLVDEKRIVWNKDLYAAMLQLLAYGDYLTRREQEIVWSWALDSTVWCRDTWPSGVPLRGRIVEVPDWFGHRGSQRRLTLTRDGTEEPVYSGVSRYIGEMVGCGFGSFEVPVWSDGNIALGDTEGPLELHALLEESGADGSTTVVWRGTTRLPLRIVPTIDDAIESIHDPNLDAAVPERVWIVVTPTVLDVYMRPFTAAAPPDTVMGLRIEFLHEGSLVATARCSGPMRISAPGEPPGDGLFAPGVTIEGNTAALQSADFRDPAWSVTITGDPALALNSSFFLNWSAHRCWGGRVTLRPEQVRASRTEDWMNRQRLAR